MAAPTTSSPLGRRRFPPALLSTVKESFRLPRDQIRPPLGPAPEPTPEPTPEPSPISEDVSFHLPVQSHAATLDATYHSLPSENRRVAPQLIETSRRCRRTGDISPTTKPTDKTDISPWMHNIYVPKPRPQSSQLQGDSNTSIGGCSPAASGNASFSSSDGVPSPTGTVSRRESMTADGLRQAFYYERKEYTRAEKKRQQDALLAAFPNYNLATYEGVEHFHARERSGDSQDDRRSVKAKQPLPHRRHSSELNWHVGEHQQHAEHAASLRADEPYYSHDNDSLVDSPGYERPPAAVMWVGGSDRGSLDSFESPVERGPMGEFAMPLIPETHVSPFTPRQPHTLDASPESTLKAAGTPYNPPPTALSRRAPVATPPAARQTEFQNGIAAVRSKQKAVTPPMAGQNLIFPKCQSPKPTKLEPDHPLFPDLGKEPKTNHDLDGGLWMGYCMAKDSQYSMVPTDLHGPHMVVSPEPPSSPHPAASTSALSRCSLSHTNELCEEPARMRATASKTVPSSPGTTSFSQSHARKPAKPRGQFFAGLDERLRQEKEHAELAEKIHEEFSDAFITQVYNYLSLGYPIMARDFDLELSKITGISVHELRRDDGEIMSSTPCFSGHDGNSCGSRRLRVNMSPNEAEKDRGPRWQALKKYIFEWAIQHPDLSFEGMDPLNWGMSERKGSWAI